MKTDKFLEIFGSIDDEFISEASSLNKVTRKKHWAMYMGVAASLIALTGVIFVVMRLSDHRAIEPGVTTMIDIEETYSGEPTNLAPTGASPTDDGFSGEGETWETGELSVNGVCIHLEEVDYMITDEDGYEFLNENYESIRSSLVESGVNAENLVISEHGYTHLRADTNSIPVNWRNYLAYSDGELVAIITVLNEETGMTYFLAFGGPWFQSYSDFLISHSGEELVFLYVGISEIVITPNNDVLYTTSQESYPSVVEGVDYYSVYNQGVNTYTP